MLNVVIKCFLFVNIHLGRIGILNPGVPPHWIVWAPTLDEDDSKNYRTLLHLKVPRLKVLQSDETLFKVGISQAWERDGRWVLATLLLLPSGSFTFIFIMILWLL